MITSALGIEVRAGTPPIEKVQPTRLELGQKVLGSLLERLMFVNPITLRGENLRLIQERDAANLALSEIIKGVGFVTHDLRTPLTAIKGQGQLVERALTQESGLSEHGRARIEASARAIQQGTDRLGNLIKELLDFTRGVENDLQSKREPLNVLALDIFTDLDLLSDAYDAELNYTCPKLGPQIPTGIRSIMGVLAKNAVEAMKHNPEGQAKSLFVNYEISGNQLIVGIADTGPGIPKENLLQIGQGYFSTNRGNDHGFGTFGTMVRVARMGGKLLYTSKGVTLNLISREVTYSDKTQENFGTKVTIILPLAN